MRADRLNKQNGHINYRLQKSFCKSLREKLERKAIEDLQIPIIPLNLKQEKNIKVGLIIHRRTRRYHRKLFTPSFAYNRKTIPRQQRARLLRERGNVCEKCKMLRVHHFHHVNGIPSDNRDENLLLLCVLCHENADKEMRLKRLNGRYK